MSRDCYNCNNLDGSPSACKLSTKDTQTCKENPSRPFWRPIKPYLECDETYNKFVPRTGNIKKQTKPLFDEVFQEIHKNTNPVFHFTALSIPTKVWIKTLCKVLDHRLSRL